MAKVFSPDTGGTLTTSLVSYYKAEDVNDFFSTNNLTNNNSVSFNAAKILNGFDFGSSNTNKSVSIASNLGLSPNQVGVWSWSAWVKIATAPSSGEVQALIDLLYNGRKHARYQYVNDTGTLKIRWQTYNASTNEALDWTQTLTTGTFFHIALVKNGTTITTWVNGSSLGDNTIVQGDGDASGGNDRFEMGYSTADGGSPVKGIIDEVGLWTKALSSQEVTDLYNSGNGNTMVVPTPSVGNQYFYFM